MPSLIPSLLDIAIRSGTRVVIRSKSGIWYPDWWVHSRDSEYVLLVSEKIQFGDSQHEVLSKDTPADKSPPLVLNIASIESVEIHEHATTE